MYMFRKLIILHNLFQLNLILSPKQTKLWTYKYWNNIITYQIQSITSSEVEHYWCFSKYFKNWYFFQTPYLIKHYSIYKTNKVTNIKTTLFQIFFKIFTKLEKTFKIWFDNSLRFLLIKCYPISKTNKVTNLQILKQLKSDNALQIFFQRHNCLLLI